MPVGFKKCCCKACDCEKSWPGDNGSLHAIWNVNKPILGTPTHMQGLVERSSASHLYPDYPYQVDESVPYWVSTDPLWQPYKLGTGALVKDLYVKRRIRITHPDLPRFTHNIACAPTYKNYFDEELPWIGTVRGTLTAWSTPYFDFQYADDVNSFSGQLWSIKDTDHKCHGFRGIPSEPWRPTEDKFHWIWAGWLGMGTGIDGVPDDYSSHRNKRFIFTEPGFLFTSDQFPNKHFHSVEEPDEGVFKDGWWLSDQCNTNATPGSYWSNSWPYCGYFLRLDLKYQSSFLSSFMPAGVPQIQAMCGTENGYTPFPFIPPVGSTPVPWASNWLGTNPTELGRFWWLVLDVNRFDFRFNYVEQVMLSDGRAPVIVQCRNDYAQYNNDLYNIHCHDGSSWPVTLKLWKWPDNPYAGGAPGLGDSAPGWGGYMTNHYCTISHEWVSV